MSNTYPGVRNKLTKVSKSFLRHHKSVALKFIWVHSRKRLPLISNQSIRLWLPQRCRITHKVTSDLWVVRHGLQCTECLVTCRLELVRSRWALSTLGDRVPWSGEWFKHCASPYLYTQANQQLLHYHAYRGHLIWRFYDTRRYVITLHTGTFKLKIFFWYTNYHD